MSLLRPRGRHARRRPLRAAAAALSTALGLGTIAIVAGATPSTATPVTGAVSTSTNVDHGTGACLHGNTAGGTVDVVNCNLYAAKEDVWTSNLPTSLGDGTYFFAVLAPGGQHEDANDGGADNLSSAIDTRADRTFDVTGGQITFNGLTQHVVDDGKIQLAQYLDTTNNGGVYILAVCDASVGTVTAKNCKYDAFKVRAGEEPPCNPSLEECEPPCEDLTECPPEDTVLDPLTVLKDADGTFDRTYTWDVLKSTGTLTWSGDTATIPYTVSMTPSGPALGNYAVTGTITVFNPNDVEVPVTVTDELTITRAGGATEPVTCTVSDAEVPAFLAESGESHYPYSCDSFTLGAGDTVDNTATVAWDEVTSPPGTVPGYRLDAGSDDFTYDGVAFTGTDVDECVAVEDVFRGGAPQTLDAALCVGDPAGDFTVAVSKQVVVPSGCVDVTNTATTETDDTSTTDSSTVQDRVCRPTQSLGGKTMGFWQNNNGQAVIGSASCPTLSAWLQTYKPFDDLDSTTCSGVKTYVTNVVKAATASGASMHKMLKGQMLATSLDVYFTKAGNVNTTVKKYFGNAPVSIGAATVDLDPVCLGGCVDARQGFRVPTNTAGALPESLTVDELLTRASGWSDLGGSSAWYAQYAASQKAIQGKAKNAFDAINNNTTYAP